MLGESLLLVWLFFAAQPSSLHTQYAGELEATRLAIRAERRAIVVRDLYLSDKERGPFWKLYGEYEAAMMKVGDRRVNVILEYAEHQDNVSNSRARRLLDEVLAVDRAELDLRAAYVKKFRKVLPDKKVTRFFQIERKMDAQLDMELARQIPLVE